MRWVLTLVIATAGCGGSRKPEPQQKDNTTVKVEVIEDPAPGTAELRADVERLGRLYLRLGAAVEVAGADCAEVARAIDEWVAANRTQVLAIQKRIARGPPAERQRLVPHLEARLDLAASKVTAGQKRCAGDERVFDAVSRLRLAPSDTARGTPSPPGR